VAVLTQKSKKPSQGRFWEDGHPQMATLALAGPDATRSSSQG
jgi:hypothetical protein